MAGEVVGTAVLPGMPGSLRTVTSPEFAGVRFHEVAARSLLNRVPGGSTMPFGWTVNPYRGCSHACTYCFARGTHAYLELDTGRDFDAEVVVKVNAAEVLAREVARSGWAREHVAMGTNTDPYQRAEGRYRLMPGILDALHRSGTPFSVLTKGTLLRRDLPLLARAAQDVPVGIGVSLALLDPDLHATLEPGTPTPRARLQLVREVRAAGLPCGVFVAPVLPHLTDSVEQLDALLGEVAAAGATGVSSVVLHLRPGTRDWFLGWLSRTRPDLVERYAQLYAGGAYADRGYRAVLARRWQRLVARHGLTTGRTREPGATPGEDDADFPAGALPQASRPSTGAGPPPQEEQLSLL
ncbi:Rv2578c family radical SAM protein [Rhodococcus aerolatus]